MERGYISQIILDKLAEARELALDAMFPKNRVEAKIWRELLGLSQNHKFKKESFSVALARLQKQGLVEKEGGRQYAIWKITSKGKGKQIGYKLKFPQPDGMPRLVMYDIPETDKKKRNWIRTELIALGYAQLQKSVWLGYCPVSENFIKSLRLFRLNDKVHILSIHKEGTLVKN